MQRMNNFHYVSPTGGNLQMTSNPKNWLLYIERQNQSKTEVWSERALMFIDAAETSLFRRYFSEILHSLLLETNKILSLWSRLRCFFLAHQQIFICCFHRCHSLTDMDCPSHSSPLFPVENLGLSEPFSNRWTWRNMQAAALPGHC